jgi:hypothetical protein
MITVSAPIVTTFVVYLIAMVGVGIWVYMRTQSFTDFALGGRKLNAPTAALSAQASDMSGWLLLGLPGAVYAAGIGATWIAIGLTVGTYLNWKFIAPRLRTYTERARNAVSLSAYLEERFEDRTRMLRIVSAAVIVVLVNVLVGRGRGGGGGGVGARGGGGGRGRPGGGGRARPRGSPAGRACRTARRSSSPASGPARRSPAARPRAGRRSPYAGTVV